MKKTIIALVCGLAAPLAFAQTSTTIVVRGEQGPVSFALGTAANIVDAAGKAVTAPLRSGQRVRVYYTGPTERRTVERVIVEE